MVIIPTACNNGEGAHVCIYLMCVCPEGVNAHACKMVYEDVNAL